MDISIVAGARPNFIKVASIIDAIKGKQKDGAKIKFRLVHTGQHYDKNMSARFFDELNIPVPNVNLNCGGGSQAEQTAKIMIGFERELIAFPADVVIVVGDVTSTLACSIVAKKLCINVAHVEAGIRSGDKTMPEEINRMVTDSITDYFFTTSEIASQNLRKAGISEDRIFFVGNTMIDTLMRNRNRFRKPSLWDNIGLQKRGYIVLTLHRPANVDSREKLEMLIKQILLVSKTYPIIFPVHPRTQNILSKFVKPDSRLHLVEPLGYLEFNYLVERSIAVITDSGGITEEASIFGVPCLTMRNTTERPETISYGTNELIGDDFEALKCGMERLFSGQWKKGGPIPMWDGRAAERIVNCLLRVVHTG